MSIRLTAALWILLLATAASPAQTPLGTAFTYQGRLKQANQPYNGSADLVFNLYDDPNAGNLLGTQTLNGVAVSGGLFTVQLNGAGEFGASAFNGEQRWLEISVNGTPLSPRQELTAGPYALFSKDSGQLGGQPAPFYLDAGNLNAGTLAPARGGTGIDTSAAASGSLLYTSGIGTWSLLASGTDIQVLTLAGGVPTWGNPSGFALPYNGTANVAAPDAAFKVTNTDTGYGLWGQSDGPAGGFGVRGTATATSGYAYGGYFESASPDGRAVFGQNIATSGWALGGRFGSAGTSGRAVYATASDATGFTKGVYGESFSTSGIGVLGSATAATGITNGVYGESDSPSGTGVFGWASATSGTNVGVQGESDSPFGIGVFGYNYAAYGVYGWTDSSGGWGVFSNGRLGATGTKSFRIDHPLDPENKYLMHYSTEAPEPLNAYSGNVVTDSSGYAKITLPDYFEEINKDFRYQLTVLDDGERTDFIMVKVVRKIRNGEFTVRTSQPSIEVSWRVEATRNDRWVKQYGAPVEVEKEGPECGKYQHPELYGQPAEKGMNYHAEHERPSPTAPLEGTPR